MVVGSIPELGSMEKLYVQWKKLASETRDEID